jgi:hypothetical protein
MSMNMKNCPPPNANFRPPSHRSAEAPPAMAATR